ncbi:hypothetical protein [Aurantimonas sp. NFXS3]|uniref:hypothetical protein n=1 Tax=Aurantimonas sp. NFXS3 TaxID=2818434 RepID=UPI003B8D253C
MRSNNLATCDEAATVRTDYIAGAVAGRPIRNRELRAAGLKDVRAWIRAPRDARVPTKQSEAPPKKRQLNLYLTNDDDTRRTAKAAAMLVDRSAAGREIIEAVVTVMEHSVSAERNASVEPAQSIRPETLRALAADQALADVVNCLAAMPDEQRAGTLALIAKVVRHDLRVTTGLRTRLRLAWSLIRGA